MIHDIEVQNDHLTQRMLDVVWWSKRNMDCSITSSVYDRCKVAYSQDLNFLHRICNIYGYDNYHVYKESLPTDHASALDRNDIKESLQTDRCSALDGNDIKESLQNDHEKVCNNCGSSFTPKSNKARFCSTSCRVANHRKLKAITIIQ